MKPASAAREKINAMLNNTIAVILRVYAQKGNDVIFTFPDFYLKACKTRIFLCSVYSFCLKRKPIFDSNGQSRPFQWMRKHLGEETIPSFPKGLNV